MQPYEYYAIVTKVIDGDSIKVDIDLGFYSWIKDRNIRLLNIDAPECRTRDLEEKKFGLYTKSIVEGFCPVGSQILLRTDFRDIDKYGRILGTIKTEAGIIVNDYLLENHLAVPYIGQNKAEIAEAHLANRQILVESGVVPA